MTSNRFSQTFPPFQFRHHLLHASVCRDFLANLPRRALRAVQHLHDCANAAGHRLHRKAAVLVRRRRAGSGCRRERAVELLLGTFGGHGERDFHGQRDDHHPRAARPPPLGRHLQLRHLRLRLHARSADLDERVLSAAVRESVSGLSFRRLQLLGANLTDNIVEVGGGGRHLHRPLHHHRLRFHLASDFLQSNSVLLLDFRSAADHRLRWT